MTKHTVTFEGIKGEYQIDPAASCSQCVFNQENACTQIDLEYLCGCGTILAFKEAKTYNFFGMRLRLEQDKESTFGGDICKKCALYNCATDCYNTRYGEVCDSNGYFVEC